MGKGKLEEFFIHFNKISGDKDEGKSEGTKSGEEIYFAGEMIKGHVHIKLKDAMRISSVKINFEGKAEVKWTKTHTVCW